MHRFVLVGGIVVTARERYRGGACGGTGGEGAPAAAARLTGLYSVIIMLPIEAIASSPLVCTACWDRCDCACALGLSCVDAW
jgi:hypothetical protein